MSALGQKQTFGSRKAMSALPAKADINERDRHVSFVPIRDLQAVTDKRPLCANRGYANQLRDVSCHPGLQHAAVVDGQPPKVMRQMLRASAAASTISSGTSWARKSWSV